MPLALVLVADPAEAVRIFHHREQLVLSGRGDGLAVELDAQVGGDLVGRHGHLELLLVGGSGLRRGQGGAVRAHVEVC